MEKKSKITKVTPNGSFTGKHGLMYKFEVHFENGDYGDANCKSVDQKTWVVGEDVKYTLTPNANPKFNGKLTKIKEENPVQNNSNGLPTLKNEGVQRLIVAQNSMTNATNYGINAGMSLEEIKTTAKDLFNFVIQLGGENGSN